MAAAILVGATLVSPVQTLLFLLVEHMPGSAFAWWLPSVVIALAFPLGYVLFSRGLIGPGSRRDSRIRRAAQVWVTGYAASVVLSSIALALLSSADSFISAYTASYAVSLGTTVCWLVAAILLAQAFGPTSDWARRSRLLAWAALLAWGGRAIGMLLASIGGWGFFDGYDLHIDGLVKALLWMSAAVVAAVAFLKAAASSSLSLLERLSQRDKRLSVAAVLILIATVLAAVGNIVNAVRQWQDYARYSAPDWWSWYPWLTTVASLLFAAAAGVAVLGLVRSRRAASQSNP